MADLTGFKETEIGPLPVEWEVVRLGEIAEKRKFAIVDGPFQIGTYQPNKRGLQMPNGLKCAILYLGTK